jgi:hypothetical protein
VLVHRPEHHVLARRPRGIRQHVAPVVVGRVVELAPVQCRDDDRPAGAEEHEPLRVQRVADGLRVGDPAAHAGVADGNGDVGFEGRDAVRRRCTGGVAQDTG